MKKHIEKLNLYVNYNTWEFDKNIIIVGNVSGKTGHFNIGYGKSNDRTFGQRRIVKL